jgi:hypothetical protein
MVQYTVQKVDVAELSPDDFGSLLDSFDLAFHLRRKGSSVNFPHEPCWLLAVRRRGAWVVPKPY